MSVDTVGAAAQFGRFAETRAHTVDVTANPDTRTRAGWAEWDFVLLLPGERNA